jgi:2-polyprenyl-3-methyl-5-hydroxy-6-metoxy-1,4-benzoquinol methylase
MNEFDNKAQEWDSNPMHWERSAAIAEEIKKLIPLNREMTALEYGAGTGITSFLLKDYIKEITLMDNSAEMIRVINEKISSTKTKNLSAVNFNLEDEEYKKGKFDLIFTQMVLHHVSDPERIIRVFHQLMNKGAYLAIADLIEEDGSFHGDGFTGHRGFNMDWLSGILRKNKFSDIFYKTCFVIDRKISENETKKFEVFIMTSKRD